MQPNAIPFLWSTGPVHMPVFIVFSCRVGSPRFSGSTYHAFFIEFRVSLSMTCRTSCQCGPHLGSTLRYSLLLLRYTVYPVPLMF